MEFKRQRNENEIIKPRVRVRLNGSFYIDPSDYLNSKVYRDRMAKVRELKKKWGEADRLNRE